MSILFEVDLAISERGISAWIAESGGDLLGEGFCFDWERLQDEVFIFCSNMAFHDGSPYSPYYLAEIKRARDGLAELLAILDAELHLGKPSPKTMEKL